MSDQPKYSEVKKEKEAYVSDESLLPNNEMKPEKRIGSSLTLSIALALAIIYLVLFLLGVAVLAGWAPALLFFLGFHIICFIIATILLWNGKKMGNVTTLYTSAVIYFISMITARTPDWSILFLPPLVIALLVFIGTVLFENGE